MAVISKAILSLNKGRMAVLFREPIHICMGMYFASGNSPKHSSIKCMLLKMVNLRVDVKKEKWQVHCWACLGQGHEGRQEHLLLGMLSLHCRDGRPAHVQLFPQNGLGKTE